MWKCNFAKSQFSTPPPLTWTQHITASPTHLTLREEIARSAATSAVVSVTAKFDGKNYPVHGSPVAEVISYTRNGSEIVGTAHCAGAVCLRETLVVSTDGLTLTMRYSIFSADKEVASGIAVFDRMS